MSKIVHTLWLPSTLADHPLHGTLAFWAEGQANRRGLKAIDHPFSVPAPFLEFALGVRTTSYNPIARSLTLVLPSDNKRPAASDSKRLALNVLQRFRRPPVTTLRPWRVECVSVAPAQVLTVLLALPQKLTFSALQAGPTTTFWMQAARLLALAIVRGQYAPTVDATGGGHWQIILTDPALQTLRQQLIDALPPATRALAVPLPSPADLVDDFLNSAGASYLALAHSPTQAPFQNRTLPYDRHAQRHPADKWWMELFPRKNYYPFSSAPVAAEGALPFADQVRAWIEPLRHHLLSPYNVTFRLEPPPAIADAEDATAPTADWRLSFHLQTKGQPEPLWAASEIWENPPEPIMPETLQAGLAHAATVFPPLTNVLDEPAPTGAALTIEQAVDFLENWADEFAQHGFGVLVPTWWKGRARKLRARVTLGQTAQNAGLFGMNSLVDFNWELAVGDATISAEEFMKMAQSKTALVQVRGEWVQLDPTELQAALKLAQRHQKSRGQLALREALGLTLGGPTAWEGLDLENVRVDTWLDEMAKRLAGHHPVTPLPQPSGFVGTLRPYQLNGLAWLHFMRQYGFGACLADDMGLGKTIQVLALLQNDLDSGQLTHPVLLICPTTVVNNWVREAEQFTPRLQSYAHHGPARLKGEAFAQRAAEQHLVVTSYALLARDIEFMNSVPWSGVVLDEAHNIKNPSTKQAQAARQLTGAYRLSLTGTPIENRLQDLWSIMHFLNPGYLGSAEGFQRQYAAPIEREPSAPEAVQARDQLRALTQPFILRRVKTDLSVIQDLPPKNEMKEFCGLTKEQAALYRAVVQESLRQIAAAQGLQRRGIILATLTKLKQVCNHPRHLLGDQSALKHRSGKLNRLTEMLEQALAEGDRCLIFTQYAEMGALLQEHLTETFGETLYLYGGTPAPQRAKLIDKFQANGARLFVLSLKAGGAGINLTRANRVFHYDRWWNPAVENQATDRAFRIGQTETVQVHKFICRGTLEERVDELITRKTALANDVVGSGEGWLTELSTDDLRDVLVLRRDALDD